MLDRLLSTLFLSGRSASNFINMSFKGNCIFMEKLTSLFALQGSTAVALYGLGNIRDERLNRMFQVLYVFTLNIFNSPLVPEFQDIQLLTCLWFMFGFSDTPCCAMDAT